MQKRLFSIFGGFGAQRFPQYQKHTVPGFNNEQQFGEQYGAKQ